MSCEINSIVKLNDADFPSKLVVNAIHTVQKSDYRIYPIDVPLQLVDSAWNAHCDVVITRLTWADRRTDLEFRVDRIYAQPFVVK